MQINFARPLRKGLAAALVALAPVACLAQAAEAIGMVEQPCASVPALPAAPRALVDQFMQPGAFNPVEVQRLLATAPMVERARLEQSQRQRDWPGLCRYATANAALMAQARPVRGVFLGDSITELWSEAGATVFGDQLINRGIAGQTTPQILLRFYADVVALHPRFVHIMAGTNDIAGNTGPTSAQRYMDNISAMVAIARQHHIQVLLASIPPAASMPWRPTPATPERIGQLNQWLRALARREGLTYIDYHAALSTADGAFRPDLSNDGVHPNNNGYLRMRAVLDAALGQLPTNIPTAGGPEHD
ncbi:GDSL-type esterase/lipase family protein [Rugamonas apoptosis]|uniref:GDSL family lipase n=1 Tax=Rugamonas apoptosis TaxID=2758570 RepID=A0A7W2ILC5_9BURK|nr:GDSL-type esterase/lipase family protein [Rugamonas apoptosis]MBA5688665.1 GDSL family lipase [Rugamonas apoptosis]